MGTPEEKTNLVAQIEAFGLEQFRIVERPLVPLRHDEIRIHVHAASLNYRDLLIALGHHCRRLRGSASAGTTSQHGSSLPLTTPFAGQQPAFR
jgi:NADPH:quinone reductase-like Zn-dependent oxidoreductase